MTASGPRTVGVVVEAPADAATVRTLVDRVLCSSAEWITDELVESLRAWRGFEPETAVAYWKAWHISGFWPVSPEEHEALRAERKRLGFDPTEHSHRLGGEGKRNAKPVLQALTGGDREREHRCLTEPALESLQTRGAGNGLADFLEELRVRVVPILV